MILYILSFLILFFAEICGTLHGIYLVKGRKYMVSFLGGVSSALWCVKIIVVMNQPFSIITAFLGAYFGTLAAFNLEKKFGK
jgi:uncharacterized protein involved in cysteine biosynthesis